MKLLFPIVLLTVVFLLSGCNVYTQRSPYNTSSARAAYGDAAGDFDAHQRKNQKRKKKARKARKDSRNSPSVLHGRPY